MHKFIFSVPEIHYSEREVIASTHEEAIALLNAGRYWDGEFLSYSESLEPVKFETQEATDDEIRYWNEEFNNNQLQELE